MSDKKHALYRFFDETGDLLYVGITMNPAGRWAKHRADKSWWHEVSEITLVQYDTRSEVLAAETEAIKTEHPRYNKAQAERRQEVVPAAPEKLIWHCYDCGLPVEDEAGSMNLDLFDLQQYESDMAQWQAAHDKTRSLSLGEAFTAPRRPQWYAQHLDCVDLDNAEWLYAIAIHQVRTPAGVLAMTSHLMGKNWFRSTGWDRVLDAAARGGR